MWRASVVGMNATVQQALNEAERLMAGDDRGAVLDQWSRLCGLLDLEASGEAAVAAQAMVLRLQFWLDARPK